MENKTQQDKKKQRAVNTLKDTRSENKNKVALPSTLCADRLSDSGEKGWGSYF